MGNNNCVADGGSPHQMTITIVNRSGVDFELDPEQQCLCEAQHSGFYAVYGKFNHKPQVNLSNGGTPSIINVSGREGSAVCPQGWIRYRATKNHKAIFRISYSSVGWISLCNSSYVRGCVYCNDLGVNVCAVGDRSYEISLNSTGSHISHAGVASTTPYSLVHDRTKRLFLLFGNNMKFLHRILKEKFHFDAHSLNLKSQSYCSFIHRDFKIYFCHSNFFTKDTVRTIVDEIICKDPELWKIVYLAKSTKSHLMALSTLGLLLKFETNTLEIEDIGGSLHCNFLGSNRSSISSYHSESWRI